MVCNLLTILAHRCRLGEEESIPLLTDRKQGDLLNHFCKAGGKQRDPAFQRSGSARRVQKCPAVTDPDN